MSKPIYTAGEPTDKLTLVSENRLRELLAKEAENSHLRSAMKEAVETARQNERGERIYTEVMDAKAEFSIIADHLEEALKGPQS